MDKIEELLTRGVDKVYPTREELEKVLRSGKKLKVYQGFDPTGDKLHIGHMVGLMKLKQWQDLGHHVIFLIGDFTAMVGDPTGKYSARQVLTHEQTLENAKDYKNQASKILKFDGENPAEILFNGDWLGKLSAIEFIRISKNLTFAQVVERDMFQERLKQGQDVSTSEFLYPVMQAYDSVEMEVDVEVGGRDQMFNMMMGRRLMKRMKNREKFVMTTILLEDSEGKKIGKTEGNAIGLTDSPSELFGSIMSFPDEVIVNCFECLTYTSMEEIQEIKDSLENGQNPITSKKKLAFEVIKVLNSEEAAKSAQEEFEKVHQKGGAPTAMQALDSASLSSDATIVDAIINSGLAKSRADAKRVITQGGVSLNDQVITDPAATFSGKSGDVLKYGKHEFREIK